MTHAAAGRTALPHTSMLYIDGAFAPGQAGRSYPLSGAGGTSLGAAAQADAADAERAVAAARGAFAGWAARSAMRRGQTLYRVAEILEGRQAVLLAAVAAAEGLRPAAARAAVDAAVDRWLWYAGWADKVGQVLGAVNQVAGPFLNVSTPEPVGVVAVLAPASSSLLGLVSVLAPPLVTGNTVVAVAAPDRPLPAVALAEALAAADLPAGVCNLLTGPLGELGPALAAHPDIDALDLTGAHADQRARLQRAAADGVKRLLPAGTQDWHAPPGLDRLRATVETKTIWHPLGR